ncbi:ACT domain-containing protein [Nocardioides sp.]|uniref:ACT domain-containing protein n=1 Tax=Nocardioides sp. TaxID=35761 RepID=UPI00271D4A8C|nr:ACT domain-containing protein [Nocardioides sp.]MDO9454837.1 ACT domain-containing protein [Nocardioides sp.]
MSTIHQFPEKLAVLKLASGAEVPAWAESSSLFSVTATAGETSLVCAGRSVPTKIPGDRGLIGFTLVGEVGSRVPSPAGVLVELLTPLAEEGIAVHTITTFSTVWVLVPVTEVERATEAWRRRGHTVAPAPVA